MSSSPALVEIGPGPRAGRRTELSTHPLSVVGRDPASDIVFADETVSRRHASLRRQDGETWLADLNSTGGTYVNGERLLTPRRLVPGDRIDLGALQLRYVAGDTATTSSVPRISEPPPAARFDVDRQAAGMINNVGRDQHLAYLHVQQQRESFAREVASTRTKARWLVWLGVLVSIGGMVLYGKVFLGIVELFVGWTRNGASGPPDMSVFFERLGDAVVGIGIGALGMVLLLLGVVFHVVATARRRRVERDYPLPPGWTTSPAHGATR